MRWPWCSRLALDCVLAENDRLRQQNERLAALVEKVTDQLVRTERFSRGMPEQPKEAREAARMPPELLTMLAQMGDSRIRAMATRSAWQKYGSHGSWEPVMAEMARRPVMDAEWEEEHDPEQA